MEILHYRREAKFSLDPQNTLLTPDYKSHQWQTNAFVPKRKQQVQALLSYWCVFFSSLLPRINNHSGGLEEKLEHVFLKAGVHTVAQNWFVLEVKHKSYRVKRNYIFAISMGYWPNVSSRWLDISQILSCVFMDRDGVEVHKHTKIEGASLISSHLNRATLVNQTLKDFWYGKRKLFIAAHLYWNRVLLNFFWKTSTCNNV